jgi:hypothetical protein
MNLSYMMEWRAITRVACISPWVWPRLSSVEECVYVFACVRVCALRCLGSVCPGSRCLRSFWVFVEDWLAVWFLEGGVLFSGVGVCPPGDGCCSLALALSLVISWRLRYPPLLPSWWSPDGVSCRCLMEVSFTFPCVSVICSFAPCFCALIPLLLFSGFCFYFSLLDLSPGLVALYF